MSFTRHYLDTSTLHNPPPSPWRARAELIRRRPRFRQIVFVAASIAFIISVLLLIRVRDESQYEWVAYGDDYPLHSAAARVRPKSPLSHKLPHKPALYTPEVANNTHAKTGPAPVVFSLIMFSEDSAAEGAVLMKSIIMYSSVPIEFHVICDDVAQTFLEKRLRLVTRPARNILVRFYRLSWSSMVARIEREGAITTDHSAGTPGLMKLFIHEILPPSVPRAIFIDTDAFFITDPAQLWDAFTHLKPTTAIAMPTHPEQSAEEWHHANRICSCIMLLDLARLRALRLMDSTAYRALNTGNDGTGAQHASSTHPASPPALAPPAFEAMFGKPSMDGHYKGVKLGDQGYWWAIVSHRPDVFEHLGFSWEVSSCLLEMYGTALGDDSADDAAELHSQIHTLGTPHEGEVVLPKMLHFNCLDGTSRYYQWDGWSDPTNPLTRRWWPAVQYHIGFKWLWLNTHQSNATLTVETVDNVVFADELFAQQQSRRPLQQVS
ncbi:uncharacterized protein FIBRA_07547 [Fibroporia radiculosa]|uniref:Glycosyltransferase family 8 protein n=1 Tax=Fibroporia radiculosa TaxID=599839 RepID=J4GEU7_9APHY|nr:uncharacterized protein FIBRA_07547 [Fibroporia radiculosa]CCM05333.1 predicted protein [Fibroporia radiculosa]